MFEYFLCRYEKYFKHASAISQRCSVSPLFAFILNQTVLELPNFKVFADDNSGIAFFREENTVDKEKNSVYRDVFQKALSTESIKLCCLVVLGFNATLTAYHFNTISWRSMTHMCFLAFSHQY